MKKINVLVVESDLELLEIIGSVLAVNDYKPEFALTGAYAFERIIAGGIDAVISDDAGMDIDGLTLLKHIRAAQFSLPFVLLSTDFGASQSSLSDDIPKLGNFLMTSKIELVNNFKELVAPVLNRTI